MAKKNSRTSTRLTPRQIDILTVIRDVRRTAGYSPTLKEIADKIGISKVTVFEHVESLILKGMMSRRRNKSRSLELMSSVKLPSDRPPIVDLIEELIGPRTKEQAAKLVGRS